MSCNDYYMLNDPTRNLGYSNPIRPSTLCDNSNYDKNSTEWQGPGWYRFGMPAGTTITEELVEPNHCNALLPTS